MEISLHRCNAIKTGMYQPHNSNGLELVFTNMSHAGEERLTVQTYNLPLHVTDALRKLLDGDGPQPVMDEAEIRADERRRMVEELQSDQHTVAAKFRPVRDIDRPF